MKATRETIPTLVRNREQFVNGSGTLRGMKNPLPTTVRRYVLMGGLDEDEAQTLQAHSDEGLTYLVVSFKMPIAWETESGIVHIVEQPLTQTSSRHRELVLTLRE